MDPRRELSLINKTVRRRNREAGESILWYQFSPLQGGLSQYDDVYDEGVPGSGGRQYLRPIVIPTIYLEEMEDEYRAIDDGRQPVQTLKAIILFKDVESAGMLNAREYNTHLNDVFSYDDRYYKVREYSVRGRLGRDNPTGDVILSVEGYEVFLDQEFLFDPGPQNPRLYDLPWPTSFPS